MPISAVLDGLFNGGPARRVTLEWVMRDLGDRSFGVVLLLLALMGAIPGVSVVAGLLLVAGYQMLRGRPGPVFPRAVATRPIAAVRLAWLVHRAVPVMRALERLVHPRWLTPVEGTKRAVGGAVLLLSAGLFVPVPLRATFLPPQRSHSSPSPSPTWSGTVCCSAPRWPRRWPSSSFRRR